MILHGRRTRDKDDRDDDDDDGRWRAHLRSIDLFIIVFGPRKLHKETKRWNLIRNKTEWIQRGTKNSERRKRKCSRGSSVDHAHSSGKLLRENGKLPQILGVLTQWFLLKYVKKHVRTFIDTLSTVRTHRIRPFALFAWGIVKSSWRKRIVQCESKIQFIHEN